MTLFAWSGIQQQLPQPRSIYTIHADGTPIAAICLRDSVANHPLILQGVCDVLAVLEDNELTPLGDTP